MGLLHRQQMNWFRLPIVGLPGTACVIPVTPDGRALDDDGEPLPVEVRTEACTEPARWMLNNDQTWLCQEHAAQVAVLAGDSIEEIEAALDRPLR